MKRVIDWFEIPTTDLERAMKFYGAIFEIELTSMHLANRLRMAMFPADPDGGTSGALCHHPEYYMPSQAGTLVYFNADPDLSVVLGRVEKAGGSVLVQKQMISPEHGYMAVFFDTEGNRVALHSRG
jgi:predicted enzyme related to lactoylglutathione lyase